MRSVLKLTVRTIRSFFTRYLAIFLIVALGVGFFSGLKITKRAMRDTLDEYYTEHDFYDYRLISTLGFDKGDADDIKSLTGINDAECAFYADAFMKRAGSDGEGVPYRFIMMPERMNMPDVTAGRLPRAADEIFADDEDFGESDIGKKITVTETGDGGVFAVTEFTIVGVGTTPLYVGIDRGTTTIGSGALSGFFYVTEDAFSDIEAYNVMYAALSDEYGVYTDEYNDALDMNEDAITDKLHEVADARRERLIEDAMLNAVPEEMRDMLPDGYFDEGAGLAIREAVEDAVPEPDTYVLSRREDAGYVSFDNDTSIISGIADILPIFFVMIAVLVCTTTMTRMVDEERTQIGTLKSLGFSGAAVAAKYMLYSGSATLFGWCAGYFLGTWGLPKIFWYAYSALYDFAPIKFVLSPKLAYGTLIVALVFIVGAGYLSCWRGLSEQPAQLIRPKAAKTGKRVILEHVGFIWNRLSFLSKITARNMLRYKRRLFMMLIGIGCCSALVVTAFGIRDSMTDVGDRQFEEVQTYDLEVSFDDKDAFSNEAGDDDMMLCAVHRVDASAGGKTSSVNLYAFESAPDGFWHFADGGENVPFPGGGEAILSVRASEMLDVNVGGILRLRDADGNETTVRVSGIFDNFIDNYVMVGAPTLSDMLGEYTPNTSLCRISGGDIDAEAQRFLDMDSVTAVKRTASTRDAVSSALECLDYIIIMIIAFSGALAFIVIFNLTNINLAERSREVATVLVLGFYPRETDSYILRENVILSVMAAILGLPLGTALHAFVMSRIKIDFVHFETVTTWQDYVLAFVITTVFAAAVNLLMRRQISKIHMAESLKAVE